MDGDPIIEVRSPSGVPLEVVVTGRLDVGRSCPGLILDDRLLSRRHLAIGVVDHEVTVEDLGSRNGSTIDGVPVRGTVTLRAGQVLTAGGTEIRVSEKLARSPAAGPTRVPPAAEDDAARNALRQTVAAVPVLPAAHRTSGAPPATGAPPPPPPPPPIPPPPPSR